MLASFSLPFSFFFFSFFFSRETRGRGCGATFNTRASTISAGSPKDGGEWPEEKVEAEGTRAKRSGGRIFTLTPGDFCPR